MNYFLTLLGIVMLSTFGCIDAEELRKSEEAKAKKFQMAEDRCIRTDGVPIYDGSGHMIDCKYKSEEKEESR